MYMQAI